MNIDSCSLLCLAAKFKFLDPVEKIRRGNDQMIVRMLAEVSDYERASCRHVDILMFG